MNRLFHFVNETLFNRPIYQAQLKIYEKNLFIPAVCTQEKDMKDEKLQILQAFFDLLTSSKECCSNRATQSNHIIYHLKLNNVFRVFKLRLDLGPESAKDVHSE